MGVGCSREGLSCRCGSCNRGLYSGYTCFSLGVTGEMMNRYNVTYKRKTEKYYWGYASEIIQARGLMHAQKLANDHLKEMKKLESMPLRIDKIVQVIE